MSEGEDGSGDDGVHCNVSRTRSADVAGGIGLGDAEGLSALAHGGDVGSDQGVAPSGAGHGGCAHVACAQSQGDGGTGFVGTGDGGGGFTCVDGVVSGNRADSGGCNDSVQGLRGSGAGSGVASSVFGGDGDGDKTIGQATQIN